LLTGILLVLLSAITGTLSAQTANGTIRGLVTDTTGAIVSQANVTLRESSTGLLLRDITKKDGLYNFQSLLAGSYEVTVSQKGFQSATASIVLEVGQTAQIDLTLTIGSQNDTVVVNAAPAARLEAGTSELSYTVTSQQVIDLPLNGRNPYGLAELSPGIIPGGSFGAGLSTVRAAVVSAATNNFQTNGGIAGSNEILLDGISIIVCCQGQPPVTPSVEVVDQFKVITSVPPASFGRSSGGVLNIVTKSGSNYLHGDIFDFLRNDQLDAANFFVKRSGVYPIPTRHDFRTPQRFNQFGGFVGGPVVLPKIYDGRDETFFTFGYEGVRNLTYGSSTTTVPSALMRQGIFTDSCGGLVACASLPTANLNQLIYDPNNLVNSYTRALLPAVTVGGVNYPAGTYVQNIDPVAAKLLQFIPTANINTTSFASNYIYFPITKDNDDQYNFRIDHNFSGRQRSFIRGTKMSDEHYVGDYFGSYSGPNSTYQRIRSYLFALSHVWVATNSLVLQGTYGFNYQLNDNLPGSINYTPSIYGFSSNFASQQQIAGIPYTTIADLETVGSALNIAYNVQYTHTLGISAILQRAAHTITAGYDGRYFLQNAEGGANPLGELEYNSNFTSGPIPDQQLPVGQVPYDSFAAFLLGAPSTATITRQVKTAFSQPYNAVFLQDDWRIFPKLTLNLGIRAGMEVGFRERHNHWADFNPTASNPLSTPAFSFQGGAQFLGIHGNPSRIWNTTYRIDPRVGFSYAPVPATVIRGAYGILSMPTTQRGYSISNMGYAQTTSVTSTNTSAPTFSSENPFASGVLLPQGASAGTASGSGGSGVAMIYKTPDPYQQQWNAGIEQELTPSLYFRLYYAGGHGVKLPLYGRPNDLNPKYWGTPGNLTQAAYLESQVANPFYGSNIAGTLASLKTVPLQQLLSAYPQYYPVLGMVGYGIEYEQDGFGSASFNALQAGLVYRNSKGVNASFFFIWSKQLGNVSDLTTGFLNATGNPSYQNYYLFKQDSRSNMVSDIPHRVVTNIVYPLPFGRGQRFGNHLPNWADATIGGWRANAIVTIQSGNPLSFSQTGGQSYSPLRPSYVLGVNPLTSGNIHNRLGGAGETQGYLNPAAYQLSQAFTLGNVPFAAALTRSPIAFRDDLSLAKLTNIHKAFRLEFRAEAFNVLNKVQFGFPNTQVGGTSFGTITYQGNLPRQIQVALRLFF
jgi:hypothetical protein